jgi:hypothetical protein
MRQIVLLVVLTSLLFSQERVLSPVPLPKTYVIDYSVEPCDDMCLDAYYKAGKPFSFIMGYSPKYASLDNGNRFREYASMINLDVRDFYISSSGEFKIALIIPKKVVGRYAVSVSHSILAYLLLRNPSFSFKVIDSKYEDENSLRDALNKTKQEGFTNTIALLTPNGATNLNRLNETQNLEIYIPSINKSAVKKHKPNIIYGGIDYKAQIDTLTDSIKSDNIIAISDGSPLSSELDMYAAGDSNSSIMSIVLDSMEADLYKKSIKSNAREIRSSAVLLNSSVVKSAMFMSQLTFNDVKPRSIISSQINYTPSIFSLTQRADRSRFRVANSITSSLPTLQEANEIVETDIQYDWINYSTSIGLDDFYTKSYLSSKSESFKEIIIDNQVSYEVELLETEDGGFFKKQF